MQIRRPERVKHVPRVPDAVLRSSRCSAEPRPMAMRSAQWTPDQQRTTPQDIARRRRA